MKNISFIKLCFCFFVLGLVTYSCKRDTDIAPTDSGTVQNIGEHAQFYSSDSESSERLTMVNESIILTDTSLERNACTRYSAWTKVAEVSTFSYDGHIMSATHIAQDGDLVAVSYHARGTEYKGIVEVVDISNPNDIKFKGQVNFVQADVNAITIGNGLNGDKYIWVALADKKKGAMVAELKLKSNSKLEENYLRLLQLTKAVAGENAASANSIVERGNYLFVTAGKSTGGVFTVDKESLELVNEKRFSNAKGVAIGSFNKVAAIQTTNGIFSNAHDLEADPPQLDKFFGVGGITHQNVADPANGKVSAAFSTREPNFLFVASGDAGVKGYDLSGNNIVYTSPEAFVRHGNANGISFDDQYMYVAVGADGIAICPMNGALPDESSVFLWDMDEPDASANFISSGNGWVVIAKGEGGFKLLKKATPGDKLAVCDGDEQGVPHCLSNDVTVCGSLIDRLNSALPIDSDVANDRPDFFGLNLQEIYLQEDTKLKITFVEENTDLQNSIGYYFYHDDCPAETESDLVGMLAFENYSTVGSKGNLEKGNTVKLPGTFKAGTRIGFFLVRNGFVGSNEIYYSRGAFNDDGLPHCLLFSDDECGDIIGAFQGNPMPSLDADFRDAIFKITPSNPSAINTSEYLRL